MFNWKNNYKWGFQPGGIADSVGPNESDTGIFEGHPYKGLAKEILQNSLDARDDELPDGIPVKVEFALINVPQNELPDINRLDEVIGKCCEFFNAGDDGAKVREWKALSEKFIQSGNSIPVLKISDYNTKGLDGVHELNGTTWSHLVRQKGASNKTNGQGGSHGVGKFAPYSFTAVRTVLYSTKNKKGETAFQGKTLLTSFIENNTVMLNQGVFGDSSTSDYQAIFDMEDVPEVFRRSKYGTDVIAVAFDYDEDWMEQIALSVLQYCFYTLYTGALDVTIRNDVGKEYHLCQKNLDSMMSFFQQWYEEHKENDPSFEFTAPKYLGVLKNPNTKHHREIYMDKGCVELYLLVDPQIEDKCIYEMRKTGMQIQEDTSWRISAHFNGLFIATGDEAEDDTPEKNIDSLLRRCEDMAHNEWVGDYYSKNYEENKKATEAIVGIHKWILQKIKDEIPEVKGDSHDAFGLDQYLQNPYAIGEDEQEENAYKNYEPIELETETVEGRRKPIKINVKANGKGEKKEEDPEKPKKPKKPGSGNPKPNNKRSKKKGQTTPVGLRYIAAPYNPNRGKYIVTLVPGRNIDGLSLKFRVNTDDQMNTEAVVLEAIRDNKKLQLQSTSEVSIGDVRKDETIQIEVALQNTNRMSLEVNAYVEQ